MEKNIWQKKYSLFTALAMIVWIVIGSGIFFKADDVLKYTNGNVVLWVVIFCLAAISIIFWALTIAQFAKRTDSSGWLIAYADEFVSPTFSTMFWWFQTFLYYPALTAIIAWVVWIYICVLFWVEKSSLELQMWIGLSYFFICYFFNIFSAYFAGKFQELTTIIKLIPLIVLWVFAFFAGNPTAIIFNPSPEAVEATKSLAWFAAVIPVAFAFDWWVVSTSISHEIKNSKKNLPLALIIAPIIILILYIIYFVGISVYVWPEKVMELWDKSVDLVAQNLFWENGGKIFLTLVIVSIMWTLNWLILGFIRLPYSLAEKWKIFFTKKLSNVNQKLSIPVYSALFWMFLVLFWSGVHYFSTKTGFLGKMDISEISIVTSYALYAVFYIKAIMMWKSWEIKWIFFGLISPILAILGSLFILFWSFQNESFLKVALPICFTVLFIAYIYSRLIIKKI